MPHESDAATHMTHYADADRRRHRRRSLWERRSSLRTKGLIVIAISLVPLVVAMVLFVFQARDDARADQRITTIREERDAADRLLVAAINAETGLRGYVATGNQVFLDPYREAMRNLEGLADALDAADAPPIVEGLLANQYEILKTLRSVDGDTPPARLEALLLRDKANMDRIRSVLGSLIERRDAQLDATLRERELLHGRTTWILWLGGLGIVLGGGVGMTLFVREIASRVRVLQVNSRQLDSDVPLVPIRGRDEIAELGHVLEQTRQELAQKEMLRGKAETSMVRARDEADRANAAKSEFLSRMSHELRTPLNAILGFAQLLEMDDLRTDQKESVQHIVRGGRHLLDLINEVLDIARIETGRLSISVEPVPLQPVIDECVAFVQPMAATAGVRIRPPSAWTADPGYVLADAQRLKQIVLNLLSNAIKYNRADGSVELTVSETADTLRLAVHDTGPGLTDDQLGALFTPFDRLGAEATAVEGTGLGLSVSKGLAEAMGASLSVASELGHGTVFFLDLRRTGDPRVSVASSAAGVVRASALSGTTARMLYIEDNTSNLSLVESILGRRPGIELLTARAGLDGLELAAKHRPDVILLDLNLPDIDGDEVLRLLRKDQATSSIPVIMVSADASSRQVERLKLAGAADYLTKPLDVQRFLTVVDGVLAEGAA